MFNGILPYVGLAADTPPSRQRKDDQCLVMLDRFDLSDKTVSKNTKVTFFLSHFHKGTLPAEVGGGEQNRTLRPAWFRVQESHTKLQSTM